MQSSSSRSSSSSSSREASRVRAKSDKKQASNKLKAPSQIATSNSNPPGKKPSAFDKMKMKFSNPSMKSKEIERKLNKEMKKKAEEQLIAEEEPAENNGRSSR